MIRHVVQREGHDHLLDVALLVEFAEGHVLRGRRRRQLRPALVPAPSSHVAHVLRDLRLFQDHGVALLDDRRHKVVACRHHLPRQRFRTPVAARQQQRLALPAGLAGDALAPRHAARVLQVRYRRRRRRRRRYLRHRRRRRRRHRHHRCRYHRRRYYPRRWQRRRVHRRLGARRRALLDHRWSRYSHSFVVDADRCGLRKRCPFPKTSTTRLPLRMDGALLDGDF